MFSNKKVEELKSKHKEEVSKLEKKIDDLKTKLMFDELGKVDYKEIYENQQVEYELFKKDTLEREDYYSTEIGRLRRMVASEKEKRVNAACANRRRNFKRFKTE